jgi:hypothetical protein
MIDFDKLTTEADIESTWTAIQKRIAKIIDHYAPLKRIVIKNKDQSPWVDKELMLVKDLRDYYYVQFKKKNNIDDLINYSEGLEMNIKV